jgi:hypothetical protein
MTKYRIAWENQVPWLKPGITNWKVKPRELGLYFDLDKLGLEIYKMDEESVPGLPILGGSGAYSSNEYANMTQAKMASVPTLKDRLALAVQQAEKKLADAKRAKEIFAKNPELEELLNIMQRGHF